MKPTVIYEDNSACIIQMNAGYPKLFYPRELPKNGEIEILQIKSCDNLADLFTKSLQTVLF
jgi:hypothetical protein